jgi:hypothetical protein
MSKSMPTKHDRGATFTHQRASQISRPDYSVQDWYVRAVEVAAGLLDRHGCPEPEKAAAAVVAGIVPGILDRVSWYVGDAVIAVLPERSQILSNGLAAHSMIRSAVLCRLTGERLPMGFQTLKRERA